MNSTLVKLGTHEIRKTLDGDNKVVRYNGSFWEAVRTDNQLTLLSNKELERFNQKTSRKSKKR